MIQKGELNAVTITYVTLGLILIIIWVLIATNRKMPKTADAGGPLNFTSTFGRLFRKKHYVWGVVAQFFYVGAQIGVWSFTIRYVMKELRLEEIQLPAGKTPEQMAATYYLASLILFTLSRFVCTWLMKFITPAKLLSVLAALAVFFTAMVIYAGGRIGVYALVGISGCMSLMFPTIFGLACRGLGEDTKLAGSGLILAIFGGAFFTQLQGVVSDMTGNINLAFWVPLCCFAVIAYYGMLARRDALG